MPVITLDTIIKMPNTQKVGIVGGIVLVMLALFCYLVYFPARDELKGKQEELSKLQEQYNEQQKVLADLPRFRNELKGLQAKFDESLKMLPNSREIPTLLTNISNLAHECGLEIFLFQPRPEMPQDFYSQIPVEMKVTGKYHELGYFFDKLSKLSRIVNIAEMDLKGKTDKAGITILDASFNAITFKFIEKKESSAKPRGQKKE